MRLPNADTAIVDPAKITAYSLNALNPQNGGKARLFGQFGFSVSAWQTLADTLAEHPRVNDVRISTRSIYGVKYIVVCNFITPDGRNPCMTSAWIVHTGQVTPRLVTAY